MLRTIPIETFDVEYDRPFNFGLVLGNDKFLDEPGIVLRVNDVSPGHDLQPITARVIHQEKRYPVVAAEVADADVLPIPPEVCIPDSVI